MFFFFLRCCLFIYYLICILCNLSSLSSVGQHHFVWPQRRFMSPPGKSLGTGTRPGGPSMSDTFQAHPTKKYIIKACWPLGTGPKKVLVTRRPSFAVRLFESIWCIWWDWDVISGMYLRIRWKDICMIFVFQIQPYVWLDYLDIPQPSFVHLQRRFSCIEMRPTPNGRSPELLQTFIFLWGC